MECLEIHKKKQGAGMSQPLSVDGTMRLVVCSLCGALTLALAVGAERIPLSRHPQPGATPVIVCLLSTRSARVAHVVQSCHPLMTPRRRPSAHLSAAAAAAQPFEQGLRAGSLVGFFPFFFSSCFRPDQATHTATRTHTFAMHAQAQFAITRAMGRMSVQTSARAAAAGRDTQKETKRPFGFALLRPAPCVSQLLCCAVLCCAVLSSADRLPPAVACHHPRGSHHDLGSSGCDLRDLGAEGGGG